MKTKSKKLIGITGRAGSGKDTAGTHLMMEHGFHRMAFADPLKEAIAALFGLDVMALHDRETKDEYDPHWGITRRAMMQRVADAIRGEFGQEHFIHRWLNSYLPLSLSNHVVVTDVRTDQEAMAIHRMGGHVILIERKSAGLIGTEGQHHTERGISPHLIDHVVVNNGRQVDAYTQLNMILENLG